MSYKVISFGMSDIGLVRQKNEDVWAELPQERVYILADGMGGHKAGEIAARSAVDALCRFVKEKFSSDAAPLSIEDALDAIRDSLNQVNTIVYNKSREKRELRGMGTTLCCLHFHQNGLIFANVGDSRIYRLRENKLDQITQDHSLLRELIELGHLSDSDAKGFSYKHIITRAIGTEKFVDPTIDVNDVQYNDIYLMCSDGLSDLLTQEEIEIVINKAPSLSTAAHSLIDKAKEKGGHDNVTVVIVDVKEVLPNFKKNE